jgi:YHS domain-containing protein
MKRTTAGFITVGAALLVLVAGCGSAEKAPQAKDEHAAMGSHEGHAHETAQAKEQSEAVTATAAKAELVPQKTCPVMGSPIDKGIYADHEGKRVYFCCAHCVGEFRKDPAKYLKKLEELGEKPETL